MDEVDTTTVFGTPLEVGFRLLFLLSASDRRALDQQRLTYFDYIVVHSKDLGGAESIHPATPRQKSELLVKRTIVNDGLNLLISRDLIERRFAAKRHRLPGNQARKACLRIPSSRTTLT